MNETVPVLQEHGEPLGGRNKNIRGCEFKAGWQPWLAAVVAPVASTGSPVSSRRKSLTLTETPATNSETLKE